MASSGFFAVLGFARRLLGARAPAGGDGPDPHARLSYESDGRCGRVRYRSRAAEFALYYELGGGDCVATIDLPRPAEWQGRTGLPLAQRDAVVEWIGRQVVRDQTTGGTGRFAVEGDWLNIYAA
jgi:hypothetical protein